MSNIYSAKAEERRKQFNRIINGIDMVLMNNIVNVDESIWDNFEGKSPKAEECDIEEIADDEHEKRGATQYYCNTHEVGTDSEWECEEATDDEVYQWFAISDNDADFLKRHGQYVTYSDLLDTSFLAITHFGTSWDYVESMVAAFDDMYLLDGLDDEKAVV